MACVKAIFRSISDDIQKKFKHSKCLMTISVGQSTHEGEMFAAAIKLIENSFGSCVLCIDDSLQRHTMAMNSTENADFFYDLAIKEGDLWLESHKKYLENFNIPLKIVRWGTWLHHPDFRIKQEAIQSMIDQDPEYKAAFDTSIHEFLKKYCDRLPDPNGFDMSRARRLSFDFILEECTAMNLWPELYCHFEIYPNKHNQAIEETRKRFLAPKYPELLVGINIAFRNAKQVNPRQFEVPKDIPELQQAKRLILKDELNFEEILEQLPGHVYWKNKEGICLNCNTNNWYDFGLKSLDDFKGKTDQELFGKEEADVLRLNDEEVMRTGKLVIKEEIVPVGNGQKALFLSHKVPLKNKRNEIVGILGVSVDITQSKQETLDCLEMLDNIIAVMPGNVYWMNKDGVYLGCNDNQAKVIGLPSRKDIVGKKNVEMPGFLIPAVLDPINQRVMETGKTIIVEEPAILPDGEPAIFLSHKVPIFNGIGEVIGMVGISVDITQRKQDEEKLRIAKAQAAAAEASDKAKTKFLENMRHDIRTPLSGIIGFSDLIKDATDNPKIHEYTDNLKASGQSLMDFLTEILDMIKFSSGELPLLKKNFNLKTELTKVLALYQPKAKEKRLEIALDYDERIPQCLIGDPKRVHRVALELVSNAVNFTHKGSITIKAILAKSEDRHNVIKLIVQDTGIGIPADKQQEIFVRFNRLTPSYEGIYKGAGLGLALVKQFVDELEGELYVESKEDQGSSFVCVLPFREPLLDEQELHSEEEIALTQVSLPAPKSKSKTEAPAAVRESHILLVEDNTFAIKITQSMLTGLGCTVDVAPDGKTAVQLFQDHPYGLIFMDIGLPDIDGYEVTQRIRLLERYRDHQVPIIALSAHADTDHKKRCIETGMNAVLLKPLSKEQASDILNAFIPERGSATQKTDTSATATSQEENWLAPITAQCYDDTYTKTELKLTGKALKEFLGIWLESLAEDLPKFKEAYEKVNYAQLQKLAHKMKGGAMYCGAARFQEACRRLELYLYGKTRDLVPALYDLVIKEGEDIQMVIMKMIEE